MTEETIFTTALSKSNPAERAAFLDAACAGDPALRRRVEALLASHDGAGSFLNHPAVGVDGAAETLAAPGRPGAGDAGEFLLPSDQPGHLGRFGDFEVLEVVGRGGMGVVFKAFDPSLRRVVAIKAMAPELAANAAARKRFQREGHAAAAVSHDHIVAIHQVKEANGLPCIVMQYIQGISLQDRLDRTGPLELKQILRIGHQAAAGLAAAHAMGVIHRDIKPANILLENGVERVKLTDFGLARTVDDASVTQSGVIAGTPLYMSPEQAEGKPVDHRSDLFSLGSVLYALCTGHPPFRAGGTMAVLKRVIEDTPRPVREVNPDIPDWLEAIIAKLHAKDPADRFQSAKEVADRLGQHLAHLQQPTAVPAPPRVEAPTPPRRKRRRRLVWLAALVPLLAGVYVWAGPTVRLHLADVGELRVDDLNPEFGEFRVVRETGASSTSVAGFTVRTELKWSIRPFEKLRLPPGMYRVEAVGRRGEVAQRWREEGSGLFSGYTVLTGGRACRVEIKRGERVRLSVMNWEKAPPVDSRSDKDRLQGRWVAVAAERPGEVASDAQLKEMSVTFAGSTVRVTMPGGQVDTGTFKLDPAASPNEIDVIGSADRVGRLGIYKFDGDHLWLCMGEDQERPREFKTAPRFPTRLVIRLRRATPADDGWSPLFNGESLAGWRVVGDPANSWQVRDGRLWGGGGATFLVSDRKFTDFRLTAEFRVNPGGEGGVLVRSDPTDADLRAGRLRPLGWSVKSTPLDGGGTHQLESSLDVDRVQQGTLTHTAPYQADRWLTLDLTAQGDRLTARIDGAERRTTVREAQAQPSPIILRLGTPATVLEFRKIEVQELPPEPAAVRSDAERIQGAWKAVQAAEDGRPLEAVPAPLAITFTVVGKQALLELTGRRPLGKNVVSEDNFGVLLLTPAASPNHIDLVRIGEKATTLTGIYRFVGDRLEICAVTNPVTPEYPTEFKTTAGSALRHWVFDRAATGR